MTIYSGDQQNTTATAVINGVTATLNATAVDALPVASGVVDYVFSANWTQMYRGQVLSFRQGIPYQVDPPLLAALNAASAPITAA